MGGHSTWLVAFTIATSRSYKKHTPKRISNQNHTDLKASTPHQKKSRVPTNRPNSARRGEKKKIHPPGVPDPDLEVGVEVGEADGGGVLERAVRLAPALQRRHSLLLLLLRSLARRRLLPPPRLFFFSLSPPFASDYFFLSALRPDSISGYASARLLGARNGK